MKYHSIEDIFLSKKRSDATQKIHSYFKDYPKMSLLDHFVPAMDWNLDKIKTVRSKADGFEPIKTYLKKGQSGDFKQFKVYGVQACNRYMWMRSDLVSDIVKNWEIEIDDPSAVMKLKYLIEICLEAIEYPSLVYPIKTYVIANDLEDGYSGILPNTTPVRRATELLFGKPFNGDQYGHTMLCRDIANELDVNPMYINTALWTIGMEISK